MTYEMHERLTRENLRGIWAAITTPFDEKDRFDEEIFRENIRRLHAAGVHGIYTTDSDGEFYAVELDEFKQIVAAFADETRKLNFPTMVGVTWTNTKGMLDRVEFAASHGILGAHVGHPYFMPMTADSYRAFWQDIRSAAPETFALIHYNTPRVHNYRRGPDYVELLDIPNFVGTKHVGSDVTEFFTLMASVPQLSHFTGEHAMTPYMFCGARGVYSWFVNFNPRYMLEWYADIQAQRWDAARHRQTRMHAFIGQIRAILEEGGHLHGIIGKSVASTSPFLVPANRTRKPYLRIPQERVDRFKQVVERDFQDMLWHE